MLLGRQLLQLVYFFHKQFLQNFTDANFITQISGDKAATFCRSENVSYTKTGGRKISTIMGAVGVGFKLPPDDPGERLKDGVER